MRSYLSHLNLKGHGPCPLRDNVVHDIHDSKPLKTRIQHNLKEASTRLSLYIIHEHYIRDATVHSRSSCRQMRRALIAATMDARSKAPRSPEQTLPNDKSVLRATLPIPFVALVSFAGSPGGSSFCLTISSESSSNSHKTCKKLKCFQSALKGVFEAPL